MEKDPGEVWEQRVGQNFVDVPRTALYHSASGCHLIDQHVPKPQLDVVSFVHPICNLPELQTNNGFQRFVPNREVRNDDGSAQEGWLEGLGFIDFAGSTVVHSVGGWAALAGTIVLGPRMGKYTKDGQIKPILGHNIPLAALGVFILWLGWFGFNPGSTTAANKDIAMIFVNTNLAAAAAAVLAMITSWIRFGKPEVGMSLNGALAGLVAITSPCASVSPLSAVMIGAAAGIIVVLSVLFFDKIKIDDPVGAISVHGVCGAWGTLAAGLFNIGGTSLKIIGVQLLGIGACFLWVFPTAFLMFKLIDKTVGLRISPEEELEGLDLAEHGGNAYPDFGVSSYSGVGFSGGPGSPSASGDAVAQLKPVKQT